MTLLSTNFVNYLFQVNEVNSGDTVFVRCVSVSVSVCVCVRAQRTSQSVKATDIKFDVYDVPRNSPGPLKTYHSIKFQLAEICSLTSAF